MGWFSWAVKVILSPYMMPVSFAVNVTCVAMVGVGSGVGEGVAVGVTVGFGVGVGNASGCWM